MVDLGDGNTVILTSNFTADGQIVPHVGGTFDVRVTHTYLEEALGQTFSVTVTDHASQTSASTNFLNVADAALAADSLTPPVASEGTPFSGTVFNFSDADPYGTASDYTALVVLGDGSTVTLTSTVTADGQIVAHAGGTFDVNLTHTYLEEITGQTFSVTVTDNQSQASGSTSLFSVADAALTAGVFTPPVATEGAAFSGTVFNFREADPNGTASDYTAVVVLGDGSTVTLTSTFSADGQIVAHAGGTFDVNLTHTYLEELTGKSFSVTVTDNQSQTSASTNTFSVADAALTTNSFTPPLAIEGIPFADMVVLNFSDADPNGTASDYTAVVVVGDGDTVTLTSTPDADGQIVAHAGGTFDVQLTHTYLEEMTGRPFSVTVTDNLSQTSARTSAFRVADAALTTNTFTPPVVTESAAFSGTVLNFSDADPNGTLSDYTATVVLGDGNTVILTNNFSADGQIVPHVGGTFDVRVTHTYLEEVTGQTFSVSVTDHNATTARSLDTFSVADAALASNPSNLTPPAATEGVAFSNVVVFHFTDADPSGTATDYVATVNTGNATLTSTLNPDNVTIVANNGGFDVQLSYAYSEEMTNATFGVSVADHNATTSQSINTFSVADAALASNPGSLTPPTAAEGVSFSNVVVFHFTDADPSGTATDYVATVNTGNATLTSTLNPSNVTIVASGSGFDVQLSYTYAEEMTNATFSVSVTDHNATTSQSINTLSVADAAVASNPINLTPPLATEGNAFSNVVVFHFTDADSGGTATDYVATVNTGDATLTSTLNPSNVNIVASGTGFDVRLSYTYAEEMTNATFSVAVVDHFATTTQSIGSFSVADAALTSIPANLTPPIATEGTAFSNVVVFHFTDADPSGTATDYVATVKTGDATLTSTLNPSNVNIVASGAGFDVRLSYTYAEELTNATFGVAVARPRYHHRPEHQHVQRGRRQLDRHHRYRPDRQHRWRSSGQRHAGGHHGARHRSRRRNGGVYVDRQPEQCLRHRQQQRRRHRGQQCGAFGSDRFNQHHGASGRGGCRRRRRHADFHDHRDELKRRDQRAGQH